MKSFRRLNVEIWILCLMGGFLLAGLRSNPYKFWDPLVDIHTEVSGHFVETPDQAKMLRGAIRGLLETLDDPHTNYLSPEDLAQFDKQTRGSFSGIGALIGERDGQLTIISPLEDSPAFKAGIQAGDIILEINGDSTEGFNASDAVKKIAGREGTEVKIKVRHANDEEQVLTIIRRKIKIQTVKGYWRDKEHHWDFMLDPNTKIGYVQLTQFSGNTAKALGEAIGKLKEAGMKGMVLDLRFNPGGLLDQAIAICRMFLDEGTIVSTEGRKSRLKAWKAEKGDQYEGDFPLVVLINESSASASEIVSGALKDNKRATIIGTRSYGKGSVQQVRGLPGGNGAIKLTTAHYYLPSGRNIHRKKDAKVWGVDPTDGFYVPMSFEQNKKMREIRHEADIIKDEQKIDRPETVSADWLRTKRSDPQLAAALETLSAQIGGDEAKKVGQSNATLEAHLSEKAAYERRRERLRQELMNTEKKLRDLDQKIGDRGKKAQDAEKPAKP